MPRLLTRWLVLLGLLLVSAEPFSKSVSADVTPPPSFQPADWNMLQKDNGNGTMTDEFSIKWVNYHDGTKFQPINLLPSQDATGFHLSAAPYSYDLPLTADGGFHFAATNRYDRQTRSVRNDAPMGITKKWTGALPVAGVLSGTEVRYPGALPTIGADILIQAHEQELRYLTVFPTAPPGTLDIQVPFTLTPDEAVVPLRIDGSTLGGTNAEVGSGISLRRNAFRGVSFKQALAWDSARPRHYVPIRIQALYAGGKITAQKIIPRAFLNRATFPVYTDTTSTFYPDPSTGATTVDGRINCDKSSGTWSVIRDAAAGDVALPAADPMYAETYVAGGVNYGIDRIFTLFDTSAINDTDTISSATLSLYITSTKDDINDGNDYVSIVTTTPASNNNLVLADFSQRGSTNLATTVDITGIASLAYLDFALNATGIAAVSKTGVTKLGAVEGHDFSNTAPPLVGTKNDWIEVSTADHAGTTQDPKLVVVSSSSKLFPAVITLQHFLVPAAYAL